MPGKPGENIAERSSGIAPLSGLLLRRGSAPPRTPPCQRINTPLDSLFLPPSAFFPFLLLLYFRKKTAASVRQSLIRDRALNAASQRSSGASHNSSRSESFQIPSADPSASWKDSSELQHISLHTDFHAQCGGAS